MNIVVLCEHGGLTGLELISKARSIAPEAEITAFIEDGSPCVECCGDYGADLARVLPWCADDCAQGSRIAGALRILNPDAVLFPATIRGRFLSAWVAARLDTGLTADCTELTLTEDDLLKQIRPAFGGNLTAEILCRARRPQMASVRPGVFAAKAYRHFTAPVLPLPVESIARKLEKAAFTPAEKGVSLQQAQVIVTGGKGVGPKGFRKLYELAGLLGGAVGATRSAVDAGWIGYEHQIGQTGIVVHPKLYLAFGVSGLIQHTVGMSASGTVIAVNKDRSAPIFRCADYGIVADWETTVDGMIERIKLGRNV